MKSQPLKFMTKFAQFSKSQKHLLHSLSFLKIFTMHRNNYAVNQWLYSKDKYKTIPQFIGKIGLITQKSLINFSYNLFLFLIRMRNGNKSTGN